MDLETIIATLEGSTEGSRELDAEIALALLGGEITWKQANHTMDAYPVREFESAAHVGGKGATFVERYTESVDAALSLLPPNTRIEIYQSLSGRWFDASVFPLSRMPVQDMTPLGKTDNGTYTMALAVCVACLRARQ